MDFGLGGVSQGRESVAKADSQKRNHVARGAATGGAAGAAYGATVAALSRGRLRPVASGVTTGALGAGVGAGVGAIKGRVKKRNVFDPERKRKDRLETYQVAGHAGGGLLAGAGMAGGASRVSGNLKRVGVPPTRSGVSNLRLGDAARALSPGKKATAATLGGLGAMAAGDAVQRYRRSERSDSYRPLR